MVWHGARRSTSRPLHFGWLGPGCPPLHRSVDLSIRGLREDTPAIAIAICTLREGEGAVWVQWDAHRVTYNATDIHTVTRSVSLSHMYNRPVTLRAWPHPPRPPQARAPRHPAAGSTGKGSPPQRRAGLRG